MTYQDLTSDSSTYQTEPRCRGIDLEFNHTYSAAILLSGKQSVELCDGVVDVEWPPPHCMATTTFLTVCHQFLL